MIGDGDVQVIVQPLNKPPGESPHPLAASDVIIVESAIVKIAPNLERRAGVLRLVLIEDTVTRKLKGENQGGLVGFYCPGACNRYGILVIVAYSLVLSGAAPA